MIIGFDAKRIVRNGTGLGSYGRTLINDLSAIVPADDQLLLYAPNLGRDDLRQQIVSRDNLRFVTPHRWRGFAIPDSHLLWRTHGIVSDLKRDAVDVYHGLSGELPWGIRKAGIASVVTIHDLIFLCHPEYYHWVDTKIYHRKFLRTIREADRIIAISECTKRDIMYYGDVDEKKIDVVYQSCSTHFKLRETPEKLEEVRQRLQLPPRYIVNVGTIETRKNILLAVKAMLQLPRELSLVIVGRTTAYCEQVRKFISANHLQQRVHILHGVENADLPAIYQLAEVCVYPSRYEGFGIPVIEAIQSGLPIVACTGSCLEEAGGDACLYVHPDDVEGMAQAVERLLKGNADREQRIAQSQQYITRFEGHDVARQILHIYQALSLQHPSPINHQP